MVKEHLWKICFY